MQRRRALLTATLGFALVPFPEPRPAVITALHRWLDTWAGIGLIGAGMARRDYDLALTRYADRGWRATFYVSGMEHSPTRATGSAWERTPFAAVQRAA